MVVQVPSLHVNAPNNPHVNLWKAFPMRCLPKTPCMSCSLGIDESVLHCGVTTAYCGHLVLYGLGVDRLQLYYVKCPIKEGKSAALITREGLFRPVQPT